MLGENALTFNIDNQYIKNSLMNRKLSHFATTLLNGVKRENIILNGHIKSWANAGWIFQTQLHKFVACSNYCLADNRFICSLEFKFLIILCNLKKKKSHPNNWKTIGFKSLDMLSYEHYFCSKRNCQLCPSKYRSAK